MITVCVCVIAIVALCASANDGEWTAFWIGVVIVGVILLMAAGERKDTRAYLNFRDYWANGGPEKQERRAVREVTDSTPMMRAVVLTPSEERFYRSLKPGVEQTADVIRMVADVDGVRHITEQRAGTLTRIRIEL